MPSQEGEEQGLEGPCGKVVKAGGRGMNECDECDDYDRMRHWAPFACCILHSLFRSSFFFDHPSFLWQVVRRDRTVSGGAERVAVGVGRGRPRNELDEMVRNVRFFFFFCDPLHSDGFRGIACCISSSTFLWRLLLGKRLWKWRCYGKAVGMGRAKR